MAKKFGVQAISVLGVVAAPAPAAAALVTFEWPLSIVASDPVGTVAWDVDGDGMAEFHLKRTDETSTMGRRLQHLSITSEGLNGRGFVGSDPASAGILGLGRGVAVGPTLATGTFGIDAAALRQLAAHTATYSSPAFGTDLLTRVQRDQLVGFRFANGSDVHFGWAVLGVTLDGANTALRIRQWTFDTVAGQAVETGQTASAVSEPAPALAMLAMGAAGLRALRRRRRGACDGLPGDA